MSELASDILPDAIEKAVQLYEAGDREGAECAFADLLDADGSVGSIARECSTQLSLSPNTVVNLRHLIVSSGLLDAELEWSGLLDAVADVSHLGESGFSGPKQRERKKAGPRVLHLPSFDVADDEDEPPRSSPRDFFGPAASHSSEPEITTLEDLDGDASEFDLFATEGEMDALDAGLFGDDAEEPEDFFGTGRLTERPTTKAKRTADPSPPPLEVLDSEPPWLDVEPIGDDAAPTPSREVAAVVDELEELQLIFAEAKQLIDNTPLPPRHPTRHCEPRVRRMPTPEAEPTGGLRPPSPDDYRFIDPADLSFDEPHTASDKTPPRVEPVVVADPTLECRKLLRSGQLVKAFVSAQELLDVAHLSETATATETATRFLQDVRDELRKQAVELLSPLDRVAQLKIPMSQIRALKHIDHRGGYLLAQIDGSTSLDNLIELGTMPREEAAALILVLIERNVIECF